MDIKKNVHDQVEDVRDATKEAMHRSTAATEHTRRDILGDNMTPGEKIKSGAEELTNRAQAEADKAKREIRSKT